MIKKNIVLIGMMAAGKSTIGFKLAKKLNYRFVDIDKKIEEYENQRITDIFQKKGERYFRKIEEKMTVAYLKKNKVVVSIGGGAFLNKIVRQKIKKNSNSFWLNWNINTILTRIISNDRRPLAIKLSREDLIKLYKKRVKFYKLSNFKVECENKTKNQIVNEIYKIIENENS